MKQTKIPQSIDEYIAHFPADIQERLNEIRQTIKKAAPGAEEKISYRMPAYTLKGILVYFAGYSSYIGFYPLSSAINAFKEELSSYKTSKGTIHFPNDKPLPVNLITEIIKFRVLENMEKRVKNK